MILYYIRHADPIYSPNSLTPLGIRQAEALAKRLSNSGIEKIFVSTSNRAKLTAQPTCEMMKTEAEECDFMNESYAFNELGVEREDGSNTWLMRNPNYLERMVSRKMAALGDDWYNFEGFNSERYKKGMERIHTETDKFFASLGYEHDRENCVFKIKEPKYKKIAVFAHQGFGLAFLSSILDIPYPVFSSRFDLGHSSMTVVNFKEFNGVAIPYIMSFSNDSHLYREGLPTRYQNNEDI